MLEEIEGTKESGKRVKQRERRDRRRKEEKKNGGEGEKGGKVAEGASPRSSWFRIKL